MGHLQAFFKMESAGGILLIFAAAFAVIMANTSLAGFYDQLLHFNASISLGETALSKTLLHWINDGLMVVFFFSIGLEIKHELIHGRLSTARQAALPLVAALGGMAIPAAIYLFINKDAPANLKGWAIPSATDIAFALGVLSLLGHRVPVAAKVTLTAIAVLDDLGAIVIIALFYSGALSGTALCFAAVFIAVLFALSRAGVQKTGPYIVAGICLWLAVLQSGVHATLAGVVTALFIPCGKTQKEAETSPLAKLSHALHPWVAFGIMPLFAFANAGVSFRGIAPSDIFEPLTLGIVAGLFIGKQLGVFGAAALAVRLGLAKLPDGARWGHLYALAVLCGIGFTMSLFIGTLAFTGPDNAAHLRLGVLCGSLLSAAAGYFLMRFTTRSHPRKDA
jgi:NhaA family Na+:H+ antiporter